VGGVSVLTDKLDSSTAEQVTTGFSKLFRDGIQIQPGISYYPNLNASNAQTFGLTRPIPSLNLQIPLLHAFDGNNPAAANERAADFGVAGAQLERSAGLQGAVLEAVQIYWRCLAAGEEQTILGTRQTSSRAYLASLRRLSAAGQVEAASLQREFARQAVADADLGKVRELMALCRADLAGLLGSARDSTLPTIAQAFPNLGELGDRAQALNEATLTDIAYRKRADLKALEQYESGAREKLAAAEAGLDPKLALTLNPDGAFLTLSRSLEHNTEEGLAAEARAGAADARLKIANLRTQIARDVSQGVAAMKESLNNYQNLRQADQDLAGIVQDARQGLAAGGMDQDQFRTLEGERADIAVRLVEAELDCALNLAALRAATGSVDAENAAGDGEIAMQFRSLDIR
jgi:outer membrane protein TolC